jgi:hypothetical protein
MRSARHGKRTSGIEVGHVSAHGLWLLIDDRELFLPFQKFPSFHDAPIAKLVRVERPASHHLYWPDLDVDLAVESVEHPERLPLISKPRKLHTSPGDSSRTPIERPGVARRRG